MNLGHSIAFALLLSSGLQVRAEQESIVLFESSTTVHQELDEENLVQEFDLHDGSATESERGQGVPFDSDQFHQRVHNALNLSEDQKQNLQALRFELGEELVMHWAKVYRLSALSLRFFNVYGPRSRTTGTYGAVFGVFLAQKLAGKPFTIVGDGEQTRDFTYVKDVVRALIIASESDQSGKAYNVGSGSTVSVNKLVELLGGDRIHIPKRPGEPDCTYADNSRISKEIGWEPQVTIEEGVMELLEHIDDWREAPVWTPHSIANATSDWFSYLGDNNHQ